jgi:hypothetical protein
MTGPVDDAIRCTPRSTTAEVRPAFFHGKNAAFSIPSVAAAPALTGYLVFIEFRAFVAVGLLLALFGLYLILFAVPFDQAKGSRAAEWTFTPQSITWTVPGATTTVDWTEIQCLVIGRRVAILHVRRSSACLPLPRRCLTAHDVSRLTGWARAQNVTVRPAHLRFRPASVLGEAERQP